MQTIQYKQYMKYIQYKSICRPPLVAEGNAHLQRSCLLAGLAVRETDIYICIVLKQESTNLIWEYFQDSVCPICPGTASKYWLPFKSIKSRIMAVSWSQFMRQITSNFSPFPNVALYSRAVLVILPWLSRLVPTICSQWYNFSASSINSSPVVSLIFGIIVVNPGWAKGSLLLHSGKYAKYVKFA